MSEQSDERIDRPADINQRPTCDICGRELGAGYLCDKCDSLEVHDEQ